jgi:hypothetical protein
VPSFFRMSLSRLFAALTSARLSTAVIFPASKSRRASHKNLRTCSVVIRSTVFSGDMLVSLILWCRHGTPNNKSIPSKEMGLFTRERGTVPASFAGVASPAPINRHLAARNL